MDARKHEPVDPSIATQLADITAGLREHARVAQEHARQLLAGRAGSLTEGQRRSLETIDQQVSRLAGIIDDLEQRGKSAPAKKPISLPPAAPKRMRATPRILIADDEEEILLLLKEILADKYTVILARDGGSALEQLQKEAFQLAIVDVQLPVVDGFQLAEKLRDSAGSQRMPAFMYLSAQSSPEFKVRGLSLGAVDYVTKPFDPDELVARIERILATVIREETLRVEALTDSLTGLANYRSFAESLEREFARSRRHNQPLCLLTVDLDHLKTINDEGGHEAGNEAIKLVAQVLKEGVRSFEVVSRQGGDEFGVLLPNTSEEAALILSERLRAQVAKLRVNNAPLSVSIGIASSEQRPDFTVRQLIEKSDQALYLAKRAGRNRTASSPGSIRESVEAK